MTDQKKDGGPCFGHGSENGHCCGATMRQAYKLAALQGILANPDISKAAADAKILPVDFRQHAVRAACLVADLSIAEDESHEQREKGK